MNCINCRTDIPASWVHCLKTNICPACGQEIMSSGQAKIHQEIRGAIAQMSHNPDGLASWILSTFSVEKLGSITPVPFYGEKPHKQLEVGLSVSVEPDEIMIAPPHKKPSAIKRIAENPEDGTVIENQIGDPSRTKLFNKLSGADKLSALADEIKSGNKNQSIPLQDFPEEDMEGAESELDNDLPPLNKRETSQLGDIFADDISPLVKQQNMKNDIVRRGMRDGSVGKINRS